jgi:hypothetical protein
MELLGDEAPVEAHYGLFDDSANLEHDWCTVCVKCTIGSKIALDAPDGTPRLGGLSESLFRSIWR